MSCGVRFLRIMLQMPRPPRTTPLTPDEKARLEHACRTLREKRVIWTLLDTGLRVNELATLTKSRLHFDARYLILEAKSAEQDVECARRSLTPRVVPILMSWFGKHNTFGLSVKCIQRIVNEVAHRAGIERPVYPEVLRRTFCVAAKEQGLLSASLS